MPSQLGGAPSCPRCTNKVYFSDEKAFMGHSWHKKCFLCSECNKVLESTTGNIREDDEEHKLYCNNCYKKLFNPPPEDTGPREVYINHEDPECCPRCGRKVYFAEQMLSMGRKFHKACYSCAECKKQIENAQAADHDKELYCKPCYGRNFGPKGYGYAGGSGTGLSMDTGKPDFLPTNHIPHTVQAYLSPITDKPKDVVDGEENEDGEPKDPPKWGGPSTETCPRCGKGVYLAEKKQAGGKSYHDRCFHCETCKKKLDSGNISEKLGEIYCKTCYGKQFGPKNYGFGGGAGGLQISN